MPKNKDLITSITEMVGEDKVAALDLGNKSNAELVALNKDLKAKMPPAPKAPAPKAPETADADKTKDNEDNDPEPDEKSKFAYSVAPGVSITCKGARILADGEEITKKDIPAESFKAFLKSGHIKKG